LKKIIILVFVLLSFTSLLAQRNNFYISTGAGLPELLNVGIGYRFEQIKIGLTAGTKPKDDVISLMLDGRFYFGEISKLSQKAPWYLHFGFDFLKSKTITEKEKFLFNTIRIGREIYFSKNFGLDLNIGLLTGLAHNKTLLRNNEYPTGRGFDLPTIFASFGIGLFLTI